MNQVLQWMCTLGKHRWLAFSNWTIVGNTTGYGDWGLAPTLSPLCVVLDYWFIWQVTVLSHLDDDLMWSLNSFSRLGVLSTSNHCNICKVTFPAWISARYCLMSIEETSQMKDNDICLCRILQFKTPGVNAAFLFETVRNERYIIFGVILCFNKKVPLALRTQALYPYIIFHDG